MPFLASPPEESSVPKDEALGVKMDLGTEALGVKRYELMADITAFTFSFPVSGGSTDPGPEEARQILSHVHDWASSSLLGTVGK